MNYLSICSGIEAASVAWHPLGWHPAAFAEIDPFPSAVLSQRWPGVSNLGDFTKIEAEAIGPIDVLVGGTPCQSFSIAGLRGGLADDRGNLALEFLKLAQRTCPRWLVWENVPGVLSSSGGRDFGAFLGALGVLGYGFAYRVLDAQYFGLAQRRKRVFVVGYLGDWRPAAAVLFERESLSGHPAPSRKARKDVAGTLGSRSTAGGGLGTDFDLAGGLQVVKTVISGGHSNNPLDENLIVIPILEVGKGSSSRGVGPNGCGIGADGDPMYTLQAGAQHAVAFRTTGNDGCYETGDRIGSLGTGTDPSAHLLVQGVSLRGREGGGTAELSGEVMPALRASGGGGDKPHALGPFGVRRLTPRECERLQGFPDDYTRIDWRGKESSMCPDGPRYRALGNSMAVPVMRWIGERLAAVEIILAERSAA